MFTWFWRAVAKQISRVERPGTPLLTPGEPPFIDIAGTVECPVCDTVYALERMLPKGTPRTSRITFICDCCRYAIDVENTGDIELMVGLHAGNRV